MLKSRNIIIIFIINYLIILLISAVAESILLGAKAQEVQLLVQTAADMALEQVQATDDFFTSGGGYIMEDGLTVKSDVEAYKMRCPGADGKYHSVNMYEAITGSSDVGSIYNKVYNPSDITQYIRDNPSVLTIDFTVGHVTTVAVDGSMVGEGTVDVPISTMRTDWYRIPNLAQLGNDIHGNLAYQAKKMDGNLLVDNEVLDNLWEMNDLKKSGKDIYVNGTAHKYYLTPLSVGVTYINEEFLSVLFMNNLDLLMRSKYAERDDYNLNNETNGYGLLRGVFYPELADTDSVSQYNPINNGKFTLLRGEKLSGTSGDVELYKGIKPKVEYVVIDSFDDRANGVLQKVFGPKFSKNATNSIIRGKEVTGSNMKLLNMDNIMRMKQLTGTLGSDAYEHKPIVVAKVTFYADFIIPYDTPSIREMRGRVDNSKTINGRTLFNPFAYSQINVENVQPISNNYVDMNAITLFDTGSLNGHENDIYDGVTKLGSNGNAFTYTTFFAVTP